MQTITTTLLRVRDMKYETNIIDRTTSENHIFISLPNRNYIQI